MKKLTLISSLLAVLAIAGCQESVPYGACTDQTAIIENNQLKICKDQVWTTDASCTEDGATICGDKFIAKCTEQKWQVSTQCASDQICKTVSGTATCVENPVCDAASAVPVCDGNSLKTCADGKWISTPCNDDKVCQASASGASCVTTQQPPAGCDTTETTCSDNVLSYCENNEWKTKQCENGCDGSKCKEIASETCDPSNYKPTCDSDGKLTSCGTDGKVTAVECTNGEACQTTENGAECKVSETNSCTESCEYGCNNDNGTCYAECNPTEYISTCSSNILKECIDGVVTDKDCGSKVCTDNGNGAACVGNDVPPTTETDCTEEGKSICENNSLKTCEGGEWEIRTCLKECKEDNPGEAYCSELTQGTECTDGETQCDGTFSIIKCVDGYWTASEECGYGKTCQNINKTAQCSNACKKGRGICNSDSNSAYICNAETLTWDVTACESKRCAVSEKMSKCIVKEGDQCSLYSFDKDDDPEVKALCDFDHMFVCSEEVLASRQPYCGTGTNSKAIKLCADDLPIYRPCYEYAWIGTSCSLGNLSQVITKQDFSTKKAETLEKTGSGADEEITDDVYLAAKEALIASSSCEASTCSIHYYTINKDKCSEVIDSQSNLGCYTYESLPDGTFRKYNSYLLQNSELKFIAGPVFEATLADNTKMELRAIYNIDIKNLVYTWVKADVLTEQECGQTVVVE